MRDHRTYMERHRAKPIHRETRKEAAIGIAGLLVFCSMCVWCVTGYLANNTYMGYGQPTRNLQTPPPDGFATIRAQFMGTEVPTMTPAPTRTKTRP